MRLWPFKRREKPDTPGGAVLVRDYDLGGTTELFGDFKLDGGYVPATVAYQLPVMRGKSRNAAKNNTWVKHSLQLFQTNIVGEKGFSFVPRPPFGDGTIDEVAAAILKTHWRRWATNPKYCDVAHRLDFQGFCSLAVKQVERDGEALFRIHRGFDYPTNPYGFALQTLNAAMLDANLNVSDKTYQTGMEGSAIINGVELDDLGKPLAYWFFKRSSAEAIHQADYAAYGQEYTRIPTDEILHIYDRELADQTRGVPGLYSVLNTLHMLNRYEEAELVAARKDANMTSTYESQTIADPEQVAKPKDVISAVNTSQAGQDMVMPRGWSRKVNAPSRPNTAFSDFDKQLLRKGASGAGQNYNSFANDGEGVSYSSLRSGKQDERDFYKMLQQMFIRDLCTPCYLAWLPIFLTTPLTRLPLAKLDKFSVHNFRGRRWPWVDPRAEAMYNETARTFGWKTDQEIAEELGNDMAENAAEIKATQPLVKGTYLESVNATEQQPTTTS